MKLSILSIFSVVGLTLLSFSLGFAEIELPPPVPEPSTFVLLGTGAAGLAFYGLIKYRNKNKK